MGSGLTRLAHNKVYAKNDIVRLDGKAAGIDYLATEQRTGAADWFLGFSVSRKQNADMVP
jgi:hypothetical protein